MLCYTALRCVRISKSNTKAGSDKKTNYQNIFNVQNQANLLFFLQLLGTGYTIKFYFFQYRTSSTFVQK